MLAIFSNLVIGMPAFGLAWVFGHFVYACVPILRRIVSIRPLHRQSITPAFGMFLANFFLKLKGNKLELLSYSKKIINWKN